MQLHALTARILGLSLVLGSLMLAPAMAAPRFTPSYVGFTESSAGEGERNSPGAVRLVRDGK